MRDRLQIGEWCVEPDTAQMSRGSDVVRLEARTLGLLLCLADHAGEVVTTDTLLDILWPDVTVTQDSVYQAVAALRRLLGDNDKEPGYIATVPRQGYRLVARVASVPRPVSAAPRNWGGLVAVGLGVLLVVAITLGFMLHNASDPARASVAVLPFLDLTSAAMSEKYVADSVTEELIDRLSLIPGLHVASATASFYYKGRRARVADIAKALHVAYVLDGSLRRSGARLRVGVRLVRTDTSLVVWSRSYDRQTGDILKVQDDIADDVAKALRRRI